MACTAVQGWAVGRDGQRGGRGWSARRGGAHGGTAHGGTHGAAALRTGARMWAQVRTARAEGWTAARDAEKRAANTESELSNPFHPLLACPPHHFAPDHSLLHLRHRCSPPTRCQSSGSASRSGPTPRRPSSSPLGGDAAPVMPAVGSGRRGNQSAPSSCHHHRRARQAPPLAPPTRCHPRSSFLPPQSPPRLSALFSVAVHPPFLVTKSSRSSPLPPRRLAPPPPPLCPGAPPTARRAG